MSSPPLRPTRCAICGTQGRSAELYRQKLGPDSFSPSTFSARRPPDGLHYRLVRCLECGLVRSDPVADDEVLFRAYSDSTIEYWAEIPNLAVTYGRYLQVLDRFGARRGALLEVGCGNGFFLEEAFARGYAEVEGIEPSHAAAEGASEQIRGRVRVDMVRPGVLEADRFDVACLFQVLDHLPDPAEVLGEILRALKPGGLLLAIQHNLRAFSARILGERSPVVDVEHTYLFTPATARRLFGRVGYEVLRVGVVWNRSSLEHVAGLFPLPTPRRAALTLLSRTGLGRLSLWLPLGNFHLIARKGRPAS